MYVPSAGDHSPSRRVMATTRRLKPATQIKCPAVVRLPFSCRSLRVDDTRTELLPELVELAEDEESSVRLAAFDTIINLMEIMDSGESSGRSVVSQSQPISTHGYED